MSIKFYPFKNLNLQKALQMLCLCFAITVFTVNMAQAQTTPADTAHKQQPQAIKCVFIVGDLVFASQALATIEIKGAEVDPFLELKNFFGQVTSALQANNFLTGDTVNFDVPLPIANNALYFMSRATLTGANAERYKRFVDAILRASKQLKEPPKK